MTWAASAWALTVPMPTSSKFVLLVLANFTDENESCFPGVSRLAETTGYSERSIKSCLALLEDEGLISRERRYTRFGGRTSDRYVLHVGRTPLSAAGVAADPPDQSSSEGAANASGADSAPNGGHEPVDNSKHPLGAESAPNDSGPVDNRDSGSPLGATDAPLGATGAPLKEEHPDRTSRSSSSTEVTTDARASLSVAAAAPPDDDEGSLHRVGGQASGDDDGLGAWRPVRGSTLTAHGAAPPDPPKTAAVAPPSAVSGAADGGEAGGERESGPLDVQQLFWAGVEVSLRDLDSRLGLSQIRRRLTDAGVDESRVDVPAAASFVLAAAARPVGDPSAYVAAAIIREPARWPWVPVAGSSGTNAPRQSICEREGHRYVDEFRMQCVRCGEERQGWRDDRYAAEQAQAGTDEAAPRRAVAS
ncbi:MAG: helix-turn-helix domain-containing protein [Mycobacteriaceae bacterium]|nr:helix-turn-helix domain-containing protein [Mycobacteriaceae bacterium]